jgi:hypothetical protein
MRSPSATIASRDFWTTVVLVVMALVMVWLFLENRKLIAANQEALADNNAQLLRLCDTTTALDLSVVVPFLVETNEVLPFLEGAERDRALRIRSNLQAAHEELSSTTLCDKVR